jgi:cytosine/adenosine deaminase-related metal-dependent hydrolase
MTETRLIRGKWVVTAAGSPVVEDAVVVVIGGKVDAVLPWAEARQRHPAAEIIGSERTAVLPGLVNAHHHSHAVTLIQHGLPEKPLEPYLLNFPWVRDYGRYLDALICGARLLSTGVTATVDLFSGGGSAEAFAGDVRGLIHGYRESGVRATVAAGFSMQSFLVYGTGEDDRFIESLPPALQADARSLLPDSVLPESDYFDVMADIGRELVGNPMLALWYAAPGPEWVSDALLQRIATAAEKADTGVQTHAIESFLAKVAAHRMYGRSCVRHLDRLGVLSPRFSLAHGVWLDEDEIETLARTGASLAHNPGSNLRLFAGMAPVNALRAAGVTVGLGMDANTIDDDEDMFVEMRLAMRLNREPIFDAPSMTPSDILGVATTGGARLMRRESSLGRLEPGFAADMSIVNLDRISWPWVAPECDPLSLLVLRSARQDVDTVLVGGEIVFRDGMPTRFDLAAAAAELGERIAAVAYPTERAAAARRLTGRLIDWYAAMPEPPLRPFVAFNSRH